MKHLFITLFLLNGILFPAERIPAQTFTGGGGISLSICSDSSVMIWGYNVSYCIGDTHFVMQSTVPIPVAGISNVIAIDAGAGHALALESDGAIWAWGANYAGSLGIGTLAPHGSPVLVPALSGMVKIASGYYHSFAVKNDGTVWAWGNNEYGQLGTGSVASSGCYCETLPQQVLSLNSILSIDGGWNHSLAIKSDSTVWSWGNNSKGQLGDPMQPDHSLPAMVPGLASIKQIACGREHSVALKSDGSVWAWGDNMYGETGAAIDSVSSPCICQTSPAQAPGLNHIIEIAAGDAYTLALKDDGTVWAFGSNMSGQLGSGTSAMYSVIPVQIIGLSDITSIEAAVHSLARKNDNTLWAWGLNNYGQLGNGTLSSNACTCENVPVIVNSACTLLYAGIEETTTQSVISIYPNPVTKLLMIQSEERIKEISCLNAMGQWMNLTVENNTIDVSLLPKGLYFLSIQTKEKRVLTKFVKQ